jgi:hypothetical protein
MAARNPVHDTSIPARMTPELIAASNRFKEGFFQAWAQDATAGIFPFTAADLEKALENRHFYFARSSGGYAGYVDPDSNYIFVATNIAR